MSPPSRHYRHGEAALRNATPPFLLNQDFSIGAALKEALPGAPMGHRMKIMTVLERGGGGEGLELD